MTWLLRLGALLVGFLILRWLWLWFWRSGWKRLFDYTLGKVNRPPVPPARHGTIKRDPVCGTFVDVELAVRETDGRQTLYFCSERCRDAHRARQPANATTTRAG